MQSPSTDLLPTAPGSGAAAGTWYYFLFAYVLAWLCFVPIALGQGALGVAPWHLAGRSGETLLIVLASLAPTVSAVILTGRQGGGPALRRFFRRYVQWRVGPRWYLVPLAALFLPALGGALVPGAAAHLTVPGGEFWIELVVGLLVVQLLVGAFGEEPGWRGFGLPRLQARYGPLPAAFLLGTLWTGWHLPLFLVPSWTATKGGGSLLSVGAHLGLSIAVTILMTWVYNHVGGSLLLMMLMHDALNSGLNLVAALYPGSPIPHNLLLPAFLGFGVAAVVVVAATRGRLGVSCRERSA